MLNKIKLIIFSAIVGVFLIPASSAHAQTCYSTLNANNLFYDQLLSFKLNTILNQPGIWAERTFAANNRVTGLQIFWRYPTDSATTQRAISTIPGYLKVTYTGIGTSIGKSILAMKGIKKETYYLYYKFVTERGDVNTSIYKLTIY